MRFSDWLYSQTGQTHRIALQRLRDMVARYLTEEVGLPQKEVQRSLQHDTDRTRGVAIPHAPPRQARHLARS
jgi:hypothetical protein